MPVESVEKILKPWRFGCCAIFATVATAVIGQSFNIDSNNEFATPPLGGGVPATIFGGAANQSGYWEFFAAQGQPPKVLKGLNGFFTGVVMAGPGGAGGLGYNNALNSGDYCALLNDATEVTDDVSYSFSSLINGKYRLFTYAVRPNNGVTNALVTVANSLSPNPQISTGTMPGNQLIQGITHTIHDVNVTQGLISVQIARVVGQPVAYVNGFQIVQLSAYVAPTSYTVTQGLDFGGSLASVLVSDDQRAYILNDDFDTNGEFEFTSNLPSGTVSQLKFKYEDRATRSDLSQFLKMHNYSTGAYTTVGFQNSTLTDSIAEGSITSGANNYYSASREVKARATWIPQQDIDASDGWSEACDQALWEMVF